MYRRNIRHRRDLVSKVRNYLADHPCVDCGESDPVVLDFDHVRGEKGDNVSRLVSHGHSWAAVRAEIEKCNVRCANCHRRKTAKELGFYDYLAVAESEQAVAF